MKVRASSNGFSAIVSGMTVGKLFSIDFEKELKQSVIESIEFDLHFNA